MRCQSCGNESWSMDFLTWPRCAVCKRPLPQDAAVVVRVDPCHNCGSAQFFNPNSGVVRCTSCNKERNVGVRPDAPKQIQAGQPPALVRGFLDSDLGKVLPVVETVSSVEDRCGDNRYTVELRRPGVDSSGGRDYDRAYLSRHRADLLAAEQSAGYDVATLRLGWEYVYNSKALGLRGR